MSKNVALVTIHGMGDTKKNYYEGLIKCLKKELGKDWQKLAFESVYYQPLLQDNQEKYFARVRKKLDWLKMRQFMLFGFGDAGGLEYSRNLEKSIYQDVQRKIFDTLGNVWKDIDANGSVVFIAQSLGCHVLSNYIWDAEKYGNISYGIWSEDHSALSQEELKFRQLKSLKVFVTTGCNIPIFTAGLNREHIYPINRPNKDFVWENYYDEDDILGWPLQELNDRYNALVRDKAINAGGVFSSWTPFSHTRYWTDSDVVKPVAQHLQRLI